MEVEVRERCSASKKLAATSSSQPPRSATKHYSRVKSADDIRQREHRDQSLSPSFRFRFRLRLTKEKHKLHESSRER